MFFKKESKLEKEMVKKLIKDFKNNRHASTYNYICYIGHYQQLKNPKKRFLRRVNKACLEYQEIRRKNNKNYGF